MRFLFPTSLVLQLKKICYSGIARPRRKIRAQSGNYTRRHTIFLFHWTGYWMTGNGLGGSIRA